MKNKSFAFMSILAISAVICVFFTGCGATPRGTAVNYTIWTVGSNIYGSGTILKSPDSGATWTRQGSPELPDAMMADVIALDEDTAWVAGGKVYGSGCIFKTANGGTTWTRQGSAEIPDEDLLSISAISDQIAWAVGQGGTIVKTINGGTTWATQDSGTTTDLEGVRAVNSDLVWAVGLSVDGYPVILKTTDGGTNWIRQGSSSDEVKTSQSLIKVTAIGTSTVWAVGANRTIIRSDDGGATWVSQSLGIPSPASDDNNIVALDADRAWIACDSSRVYRTTDGVTWELQSSGIASGQFLLGIDALGDENIWAAGTAEGPYTSIITHTDNGGTTWTTQLEWDTGLSAVSAVGGHR